jgi:hypothetical protein
MLKAINDKRSGYASPEFNKWNLRPIKPFWAELPHCNIPHCITPDIHHQLHKGVFHDHAANWGTNAMKVSGTKDAKSEEVNSRYRTMSPHPTLRHFKKGISFTSQWTGKELKNMEKTFLGVLAGGTDPRVIRTIRGILDFIYLSRLEIHTDETLAAMDSTWVLIHSNKQVLVDKEILKDFNISKFHNIKHYTDHIRSRGPPDAFNSEISERLHIDKVKLGYRASNRREYERQMLKWLQRQDQVYRFRMYMKWAFDEGVQDDKEEDLDEGDDEDIEVDDEPANDHDNDENIFASGRTPFHVAKRTINVSVASLEHDHHAHYFLYYLQQFMDRNNIPTTRILNSDSKISIWTQARLRLRPIPAIAGDSSEFDTIYASKHLPAKRERGQLPKPEIPANFSTVIVRYREGREQDDTQHDENPFRRTRTFSFPSLFC